MVKPISFLLLFLMSLPSLAHDGYECHDNPKIESFYGNYMVVKIVDEDFKHPTEEQKNKFGIK